MSQRHGPTDAQTHTRSLALTHTRRRGPVNTCDVAKLVGMWRRTSYNQDSFYYYIAAVHLLYHINVWAIHSEIMMKHTKENKHVTLKERGFYDV